MLHLGNYQSEKASEAIINGGFFGKDWRGNFKYKSSRAHTDYVISVISEEFGIIFIIFIMLIFLSLALGFLKSLFGGK